jgi:hypothetical protein
MTERRNRGILTAKDRKIMEESSPDQYPPHFRRRTRDKFKQGLADLAFISENLEEEDIAEVFGVLTDSDPKDETSYSHEPFTRQTIIEALGLFFQAAELVDDQDESVLEDFIQRGVEQAYRRHRPDLVVGTLDFDLETVPRQEAYDRGIEKVPDFQSLTSSEQSAVIAAHARTIHGQGPEEHSADIPDNDIILRGSELTQYVIDHLGEIEPGLEQVGFQSDPSKGQFRTPDVFCEDQTEQLVLIEVMTGPITEHDITETESLLEDYGGPEEVRGIVVGPDRGILEKASTEAKFEFCELQLGPYGVIKGF